MRHTHRQTFFYQAQGIERDTLKQVAPSIFAEQAHPEVSARYRHLSTIHVLDELQREGFYPVAVGETRVRVPGYQPYTKHVVRLRHREVEVKQVGDVLPELVLTNSHDRSSAYQFSAGLFRLKCLNGLVVSEGEFGAVRVRHTGDVIANAIKASYDVLYHLPHVQQKAREWDALDLAPEVALDYAGRAVRLRWGDLEHAPITSPAALLEARRYNDNSTSLWGVFNRVQENLIRGGEVHGSRYRRVENGRFKAWRGVHSVNSDLELNKRLWQITEDTAQALVS